MRTGTSLILRWNGVALYHTDKRTAHSHSLLTAARFMIDRAQRSSVTEASAHNVSAGDTSRGNREGALYASVTGRAPAYRGVHRKGQRLYGMGRVGV